MKQKFNMQADIVTHVNGPYLVLANHNMDWDSLVIAMGFPKQMYFVASEHIFRKGILTRLLMRYFAPISRIKGSLAVSTAMEIIRRLRRGDNVCIFAEGNRSFNGLTCPILPSTGKLVRSCGATLVTYRLEGGYFTQPRWGYTLRRGRMHGKCVGVYPAQTLRAMSVDQVNDMLVRDLFEDAYAQQIQEPVAFEGKRLAEGLEHSLYICPQCGRIGTLHSKGSSFFCDCGLSVTYQNTGFLLGGRFKTITQWDEWQHEELCRIARNLGDAPAFCDDDLTLLRVGDDHASEIAARGEASFFADRLDVGDVSIPISDIIDFEIHGRSIAVFSTGSAHYELISGSTYCGRKYVQLYRILKAR
ncbi:MAG: lysophospholipid acyltransferase family protein [Clostridia bacterium]